MKGDHQGVGYLEEVDTVKELNEPCYMICFSVRR